MANPPVLPAHHVNGPASAGKRRVVVTGLGAISPLGADASTTWQGLLEGRCGVRPLAGEEFEEIPVRVVAPSAVEPAERLTHGQARTLNRCSQFAVLAAREAWADAGFDPAQTRGGMLDARRVGVSIGTIIGGAPVLVAADHTLQARGARHVSPHTAPMVVPNGAAAQVAIDLGARAEARTVVAACASGTEAIGQAIDRIRDGHADVILAGGTEAVITPTVLASFTAMRALSRAESPENASRPFDKDRDGFVLGEGAGVLVLEAEEHALARGARIYCEAAGWGISADAHHMVTPRPDGEGIVDAITKALTDAGAAPGDVAHVNAHATATPQGDAAEVLALTKVFGPAVGTVPVTAPKGALGHMQGAAGGVEAVATVLTLHHGLIPPTVGHRSPDDDNPLDIVTGAPRALPDRDVALSNSFGFGGHNAVLAFRRTT
ncbi:beta-ketoacyl-[acyl-carrier-protein] synthase family protein [Kitasatospora sp. NBC_01287]|uniref:beta-ketoacyl-[acyl-carrier-protein] synthase family protein n=1 Tax=Kitasatospora sp. NBC_01287 TaxID=2903573 RepID=UPI002B1E4770|nr:beta-ketoacyl-[acyl-carrier-protein] synthase family protein [Kitasatospora sp. NBC_01287]